MEDEGVVFTTLARGAALQRATLVAFLKTGLALVAALGVGLRRGERLPQLAPLTAFLITE